MDRKDLAEEIVVDRGGLGGVVLKGVGLHEGKDVFAKTLLDGVCLDLAFGSNGSISNTNTYL